MVRAKRRSSIGISDASSDKLGQSTARVCSASPLRRFEESMRIDYEKWHDGQGYDLAALRSASSAEQEAIEQMLIRHSPRDWRDIEALAEIDTPSARQAIKKAMRDANPDVRIAVTRFAPHLVTNRERSRSLVEALRSAGIYSGLSRALDDIREFHPPEIKEALIWGLLGREGEVAVLFAAMLFYLYGKTKESFDMEKRPFFLRFSNENREERVQAFRELCRQLKIRPEKYLALDSESDAVRK